MKENVQAGLEDDRNAYMTKILAFRDRGEAEGNCRLG
jgi:hypothetical protein